MLIIGLINKVNNILHINIDLKLYLIKYYMSISLDKTYTNENMVWFWQGPFSNFYPCEFSENGINYNCSEQFFMAKKALLFNDNEMYQKIMRTNKPKLQKLYGRKVRNFDERIWNLECEKKYV